ncbi:hypothetical protein [Archangium lipolyticum]|uniref:hypothetical protein n=1 Tax=Archangium lipolyticum TaxID=2970465 RepID=UPI00214B4FC2|nr:hypothetical protein [Archangium lipolyticum]
MVDSHAAPKHTVADEGDVNVIPYNLPCVAAARPGSRQLSPMPQVPPLVREGERK